MDRNIPPNGKSEPEARQGTVPAIGDVFNPYKMFLGLFIPEPLVRYGKVHSSGKLVWARLARYAGKDGVCYPAVPTLASELGLSVRQTQTHLATLEREKFVRRIARKDDGGQTSNLYKFLWHPIFDAWAKQQENATVQQSALEGVKGTALPPVNDTAPKESHSQEGHAQENQADPDCPATNRKMRDSHPAGDKGKNVTVCRRYPRLRELMAQYFFEEGYEKLYPSDRQVVDVVDASGASEEEVIKCLRYLYNDRGLRPGTRNGPRHWKWFPTVVQDYFCKRDDRSEAAHPSGYSEWESRNEQRESNDQR